MPPKVYELFRAFLFLKILFVHYLLNSGERSPAACGEELQLHYCGVMILYLPLRCIKLNIYNNPS